MTAEWQSGYPTDSGREGGATARSWGPGTRTWVQAVGWWLGYLPSAGREVATTERSRAQAVRWRPGYLSGSGRGVAMTARSKGPVAGSVVGSPLEVK